MLQPQLLQNLLSQSNSKFKELINKTVLLNELTTIVQQTLPVNLAQAVRVGEYKNNILYLFTANSGLRHVLRFQVAELAASMRKHRQFTALTRIEVKVLPLLEYTEQVHAALRRPATKQRTISAPAKEMINAAAQQITHERLKRALLRLARY